LKNHLRGQILTPNPSKKRRQNDPEPILVTLERSEMYNQYLLPSLIDIIIHLKPVSSDLVPIQQLLDEENVDNSTKYILIRSLFSNDAGRLASCLHLLKVNSARELLNVCQTVPEMTNAAERVLEEPWQELANKIKTH